MSAPLRAPQADGGVLADPPLSYIGPVLSRNREKLSLLDAPLSELRTLARREALEAARSYFAETGEPFPNVVADSLVLSGHQPELFHPGVWIKNFALNHIAREKNATPLTLLVDNDTVKSTSLRLPARRTDARGWYRLQLPFDVQGPDTPYEERAVHDEVAFRSFADRASVVTSDWRFQPMLPAFWNEVLKHCTRTPNLGERFAAARRTFERRWGCHNLELPVSRMASTESFRRFALHLVGRLPLFHQAYNEVVREYRQRHRIRSRNHPVPDLAQDGDWLEAPFWVWRLGEVRRGRLFARVTNGSSKLRCGNEIFELGDTRFKIRPRALTTTLFARLLLADLFIHGIGGAKYDALTDELFRRFYGIEPPGFMTLSGTLLLPFDLPDMSASRCAEFKRQLRDMWFNPQRHLSSSEARVRAGIEEKEEWIRQPRSKHRHEKLGEISERLRPFTLEARQRIERKIRECGEQLQSRLVLARRDYAFCLFPEDKLHAFCRSFL